MKKILIGLLVILTGTGLLLADGTGGMGDSCGWQVITDTGTTGISFDRTVQEIYVINKTTRPVYINWVSTTATTDNFELQGALDFYYNGQDAESEVKSADRTEKIHSSEMGLNAGTTAPVNIRVQWKYWGE